MNDPTQQFKNKLRQLQTTSLILAILFLGLLAYVLLKDNFSDGIVRTKGIIVFDENGKDRILIGAPVPLSKDRVRLDSPRVWEEWVTRWPEDFRDKVWGYYKEYNHATSGILILSDDGFDRIVMGDAVPDPNIGKRIAPATGIAINDEKGFERTGYGVLKMDDGSYRVNLGLDSKRGTEGIVLSVDDLGYNGVIIPGQDKTIFLGNADTTTYLTSPYEKFKGLIIKDRDSVYYALDRI
jgi:hypothetical protein